MKLVRSVWAECHKIPGTAVLDRDNVPGLVGKRDRHNGIAISRRPRQIGGIIIGDFKTQLDRAGTIDPVAIKKGIPLPIREESRQKGREVL